MRKQTLIFVLITMVTLKNGWSLPLSGHFESVSIKQGLSNTTVNAITQDAQGYLWIGTDSGLNRYDGYQNQTFQYDEQEPQSLSGGRVRSLLFHHQNNQLWIGLSNGDLNALNTNTSTITRYSFQQSGQKALTILAISQINQHLLALGSTVGLRIFDITTGKSIVIDTITTPTETFTLKYTQLALSPTQQTPNPFLWLVADQRLFKIRSSALTQLNSQNSLSGELMLTLPGRIRSVTVDNKGQSLWLATNKKGLFHYNLLSSQLLPTPLTPAQQDQLEKTHISSVRTDPDNIWLGTDDDGLFRIRKSDGQLNQFKHNPYDPSSSGDNRINALHIDHSGVLWTGTHSDGLNKLTIASLNFGHYKFHQQYPDCIGNNKVYAVLQDNDNNTWLGSYAGGLSKISSDGQQCNKYIHDPKNPHSISDNRVMSLAETRDGRILIGTMSGLNIYHPSSNHFTRFWSKDPANLFSERNVVYSIFQDKQHNIWIGTYLNGLYQFDLQLKPLAHFKVSKDGNGLKDKRVNSIIQDHQGTLWIGTTEGVNTLTPANQSKQQPQKPKLASFELLNQQQQPKKQGHYVTAIHQDSHNTIWIATTYGVHRVSGQEQTLLTKENGKENSLSDNVVYGLLSDQDYLWMSTAKGINRLNLSTLAIEHFTAEHGIQGVDFTVAAFNKGPQSPLFFGGVNGFNAFYAKDITQNGVPPLTVISELTIHDQSGDHIYSKHYGKVSEVLSLPYQQNDLNFGLTALHYVAPQKNQYAHQLIGFDHQWVNTDANERRFRYRNLPPGYYTLMAKSSNNEGIWSKQQSLLSFFIATPWWSSWWARIIYFAVLIFSIYLIVQFYTYRIKQQNSKLEGKVAERTAALEQKNHLIISTQQQLVQSEKMASLGTLTAGVAHEINNPTNFVHVSTQNLEASLTRFQQFLLNIAGDDADEDILESFNQQFQPLYQHLSIIKNGTERIKIIVKDLRTFSQLDCAEQKTANITDLLQATINLVKAQHLKITDFTTNFELTPQLYCYPSQLNQVFMNLIVNACDAIQTRQQHRKGQGQIMIGCRLVDKSIEISIKDNGCGMSDETKNKLFEPFYTTKDVGKGTGLGLSISFGIVQQHGGQLSVKSEPHVGSEFLVHLPTCQ